MTPDDRRRLRELAAATHRTAGDVLRVLVRSVPPDRAGSGVSPAFPYGRAAIHGDDSPDEAA